MRIRHFSSLTAMAAALLLAACDAPPPSGAQSSGHQAGADSTRPLPGSDGGGTTRQRQADFLNRIRGADPQFQTIERAVLNEQNELALILAREVDMSKIPALMKTMLTQMAREFPGEDHTVVAYAPSNPPMKIGTAHLNARTRDMTYTEERPAEGR